MRYAAPEKLEIIRLVEGAQLSARQTLAKLGTPRTTFYRWYDRYLQRGEAELEGQSPKPKHGWNPILLENYFLPGDLEAQIEAFVDHYNHQRYHESLNNVTPADVYFGRDKAILKQRKRIKQKTFETRRLHHSQRAA